jgi:hypothetical protein
LILLFLAFSHFLPFSCSLLSRFVYINDCNAKLPSGVSIADRFKLDLTKKTPTIFVSGKIGNPKQIPSGELKTGYNLARVVNQMISPRTAKIETTKHLKTRCLSHQFCGLIMRSGAADSTLKATVKDLMEEFPTVTFASIDSSLLELSIEKKMGEYTAGKHRFVLFNRANYDDEEVEDEEAAKKGDTKVITSAKPFKGEMTVAGISSFVQSAIDKSLKFTKLPSLPTLSTRRKSKRGGKGASKRGSKEDEEAPRVIDPMELKKARIKDENRRREQMRAQEKANSFFQEDEEADVKVNAGEESEETKAEEARSFEVEEEEEDEEDEEEEENEEEDEDTIEL